MSNEQRPPFRLRIVMPALMAFIAAVLFQALVAEPDSPTTKSAPFTATHESRSSHWAKVRAEHLEREPACAVCGSTKGLQVHHVQPFHLHPEFELDPANLITLCGPEEHNCHLLFGHLCSYQSWNPDVREDARMWAAKIKGRPR